jgi:adenylate cyclase
MSRDADTTVILPGIVGYSSPAHGMRLRLQFDERELLMDERRSSISIGRAEDNDIVVKDRLISRLHLRIEIDRSIIVLIDQSTNGTFVQTTDGDELYVHHDSLQLKGQGMIGLGRMPVQHSSGAIRFTCEEV